MINDDMKKFSVESLIYNTSSNRIWSKFIVLLHPDQRKLVLTIPITFTSVVESFIWIPTTIESFIVKEDYGVYEDLRGCKC